MASLYITNHPPPESDPSRTHPQSSQPSSKEYKPSFLERRGLKSPPTPPPYRTPEEEKAEALRLKKIERAKKKEAEEKARLKREKQVAISNSSVGAYTQHYKKNDGSISWWKLCCF